MPQVGEKEFSSHSSRGTRDCPGSTFSSWKPQAHYFQPTSEGCKAWLGTTVPHSAARPTFLPANRPLSLQQQDVRLCLLSTQTGQPPPRLLLPALFASFWALHLPSHLTKTHKQTRTPHHTALEGRGPVGSRRPLPLAGQPGPCAPRPSAPRGSRPCPLPFVWRRLALTASPAPFYFRPSPIGGARRNGGQRLAEPPWRLTLFRAAWRSSQEFEQCRVGGTSGYVTSGYGASAARRGSLSIWGSEHLSLCPAAAGRVARHLAGAGL